MDMEKQSPMQTYAYAPSQPPPPYSPTAQPPMVLTSQPISSPRQVIVVQQTPQGTPDSHTCLSCLVFWFCNCLFGLIAFTYSVRSSSAASNGDMNEAFALGRSARSIAIAGIVVGTITYVFLLVYWLAVIND